jgi:hypothetical protein
MKTFRKTITLSENTLDMLNNLMKQTGHNKISTIIQTSIFHFYSKVFPAYRPTPLSPIEKIKQIQTYSEEKKKQKEIHQEDRCKEICNYLNGKISRTNTGQKICEFTNYNMLPNKLIQETEISLPLLELSEEHISRQHKYNYDITEDAKELIFDELNKQTNKQTNI